VNTQDDKDEYSGIGMNTWHDMLKALVGCIA
jgi:hypothetical protein